MARQIINLGATGGDGTGAKARAGGRIINENFEEVYTLIEILSRIDIITENKGFSLVGNDLTINADWEWIINNEIYTNPDVVLFEDIALSAAGKTRLVYVVPNAMNGFDMLDGEETTGTPEAPPLSNGGMYVTYFEVTDSEIGTPADGYDGNALNDKLSKGGYEGTAQTLSNRIDNYDNYGKKQYESCWRDFSLTGAVIDLDISDTESTSLNFTNAITELNSVIFPPASTQPYSGKDFYIKNSQAASFLIKHEIGNIATEQRYIFSLPGEVDLELQPKQIAHFKLKTSGDRGKIELVGVVLDESNLMHLTGDEEVDGNKTFLQPVSGEDAVNPEHLVTKAQLDLKLDAADYNNHYKGKYTSLVALETAHPTANAGDYAQVDAGSGSDVVNYNYDLEEGWIEGGSGSGATDTDALPEGSTNLYFTTARVLATVLAGLSATAGTFTSSDSLLTAFGKIKYLIDNIATTYQVILTDSIFGAFINGLTGKTTPVDADSISLVDTEDSNKQKKVSLTNFKAYLLTYFDTQYKTDTISYACSDPSSVLVVGDTDPFNAPYNFTLISYWVAVKIAPTVQSLIVDIKKNGTSITSTKASIDATEKTSLTGTSPVLTTTSFVEGDEITPSIFQVGGAETGRSLKLYLKIIKT